MLREGARNVLGAAGQCRSSKHHQESRKSSSDADTSLSRADTGDRNEHHLGTETMIALEYEMTYTETIEGPLGPTAGSPVGERLCWQVTTATLRGPRITASASMPGADWIRLGTDGIRRPDLRAQLITDDGEPTCSGTTWS
jgi:Protein of unknown function (DUF3237)